jgi:hypothetical protein
MTIVLPLLVRAAEEGPGLPVISGLFPIIALVAFAFLGVVTWSYRHVAHRHADKTGDLGPHGPAHH